MMAHMNAVSSSVARMKEFSDIDRRSFNNDLTDIDTPSEIEISGCDYVSVTFQGSLKDGCLTCKIVDFYDKENRSVDRTTVDYLSDGREPGKENFRNEKRTYRWLICPDKSLAKGRGRLEICVYEIRDYLKNGQIVKDRWLVAWARSFTELRLFSSRSILIVF